MSKMAERKEKVGLAVEIAVKLGTLALVLYISFLIVRPFITIALWAIIIAVAVSPLIDRLSAKFGSRKKVIVGLTVIVILAMVIPAWSLSDRAVQSYDSVAHIVQNGVTIPPPTEQVREWPLIGEKSYDLWLSASKNLKATLAPFKNEIHELFSKLLSAMGSGLVAALIIIGAFIIAAFLLLTKEKSVAFYRHLSHRLMGDLGDEWVTLSALTVRSVATGVIGVAVIQASFALAGMLMMDVPFALVWAIGVMFLTIIQLPPLIILGPVIVYVFSQGSGTAEVVFAVYTLIVGASDGVLKPLMMGRGVDIPMLVILVGAIGGMVLWGMIGLFVGAVVFALAYKLFGLWLADAIEDEKENELAKPE